MQLQEKIDHSKNKLLESVILQLQKFADDFDVRAEQKHNFTSISKFNRLQRTAEKKVELSIVLCI